MLKSLRAGLKELLRPARAGSRGDADAGCGRPEPSAWFIELRKRVRAQDAAVADAIRDALEREPDNAEARALEGERLLAAGAPQAAIPHLARAAELRSGFADAHAALGEALQALGRRKEAIASFERAVDLAHDLAPAHLNLGWLYEELGRDEEAADCFNLALAFDASAAEAEIGLGRILRKRGRLEESVTQLREALEHAPGSAPAWLELAVSLNQAGDTSGAIAAYEQALGLKPDYAEAWVNLGMIRLAQLGDAPAAETLFRRAVRINPGLVEAQANLGLAMQEQGRFEEALRHYEDQAGRRPDVVEFRWNRGLANLLLGKFGSGWDDYELRKLRPDAGGVHQKFTLPEWDGAPLEARSILIYGEQGLGDEIMFASCVPDVIAQAALGVVECDARLAPIYRRSFPQARIEARARGRERDWRAAYPALELQAAVGSLPRYLRRRSADFPEHAGYLVAEPRATASWRERLRARDPLPKIGISWRGGTIRTRGAVRSLTLEQLGPVLDCGRAAFVVLQRDLDAGERAALQRRSRVFVPEALADIDELAALLSAVDLVISVPSTNVHLAGALGRPAWVLLSYSPEWRYLWQGERMPWYPSVRLLRQPRPGDWDSVIGDLCRRLEGEIK